MIFDPWPKERKKDLYNFDKEINKLIESISDPSVRLIVIKGLRRTGKSSILRVALNESKYNYVLIDMREFEELDRESFYRSLTEALLKAIKSRKKAIVNRIKAISFMGMKIEISKHDEEMDYRTLFRKINSWADKNKTFFILAIDEAQEVAKINFDRYLAFIYDNLLRIKIILAGSQIGVLTKLFEDPKRPLYGRARIEINTRKLTPEEAEEFLTLGFKEVGIRIGKEIIREAINRLDGIIGWLNLFGWYIVHGKRPMEAMEIVLREGMQVVKDELDRFLETRGIGKKRYLIVLKILAEGPKRWKEVKELMEIKLRKRIANNQITRYLSELLKYGFIQKREKIYYIPDPLLRETVLKKY